jgi:16S rRNA (cytidine1402-2'-O)-methyltransferase
MRQQKSFQNDVISLYLVATPIGNLDELTPRAIEILKSVAVIAAEDTRVTQKLLSRFDIKTKVIAHHAHNEAQSTQGILKLLNSAQSVALVSDAGYPLMSDPGSILVQTVIQAGYNVVPVSGSSAFLNALVASGLSVQPHVFYGFLPQQDKAFRQELNQLKAYPMTLVFYEAPHRIKKTLEKMLAILGNRRAVLARELTKVYEEFMRGTLSELLEAVQQEPKGELVLVVEGNLGDREAAIDLSEVHRRIESYIQQGSSASEAIKQVAKDMGIQKNIIYNAYHQYPTTQQTS